MPDVALGGEHEENQEWHEGHFEEEGVKRANGANNERAQRAGIRPQVGGRGTRGRPGSKLGDAAGDTLDPGLDGRRALLQDGAVARPVIRKTERAAPKRVADADEHGHEKDDHEERSEAAGDAHALDQLDNGIEEIRQQDREQNGDDDAGGVIAEEQSQRGDDDARAGAGNDHANAFGGRGGGRHGNSRSNKVAHLRAGATACCLTCKTRHLREERAGRARSVC